MVKEPTPKELLAQRKEQLFFSEIESRKERQQTIIAQCDDQIGYFQSQIAIQEQLKQDAVDLLAELEKRHPSPKVK